MKEEELLSLDKMNKEISLLEDDCVQKIDFERTEEELEGEQSAVYLRSFVSSDDEFTTQFIGQMKDLPMIIATTIIDQSVALGIDSDALMAAIILDYQNCSMIKEHPGEIEVNSTFIPNDKNGGLVS